MRRIPSQVLIASIIFTLICLGTFAVGQDATSEGMAFFESKIRPLLMKHCYECHSEEAGKAKGGLQLDSKQAFENGGDSGEVLDPENPDASLLLESVSYGNPKLRMPPKYKLSDNEIADLKTWITLGAPDSRITQQTEKVSYAIDWAKGEKHWAFQPISNPQLPTVKNESWLRDDLDRFIVAEQESRDLRPAQDANRFALIRRISLDLTGLPPTVEQVREFIQDPGTDDEALAKIVDDYLRSPAFGERWGRYWLDVARYADSVGKTRNIPFPYAWKYRNYVIDAFNQDKPFNEFVREQIAGDLLKPKNDRDWEENLIATGFLALGSMDLNERDTEQFTLDRIDDQLDTIGRSMIGMTIGCARCHDHKFDPIAQTDYYALAGILASTKTLSGQTNRQGGKNYFRPDQLVALENQPSSQVTKTTAADQEKAKKITELQTAIRTLNAEIKAQDLKQPQIKARRTRIAALRAELLSLAPELANKAKNAKAKPNAEPVEADPKANLAMAVVDGNVVDVPLRVRGEPDLKGEIVPRGFPKIFNNIHAANLTQQSSGRLELAIWLSSPDHPLTARVFTNRVWLHLMGKGLVETADNFGASGSPPSHPELLDFLSHRFMEEKWSIKKLVRHIVLSRSYRLSGQHSAENNAIDEANQFYWRSNLRRLEVEAIRDSLLSAGDMLIRARPPGAPFTAPANADLSRVNRKGDSGDAGDKPVRSVYLPVFRSKLPGMFTVFDFAEPDQVNGVRDVTTVAPQALFMLNNSFVIDAAKRAAERILAQDVTDDRARIRYAYAYTLGRYPTDTEMDRSLAFLAQGSEPKSSWTELTQALYASAEFRYIP
jgi:mono/diheme cytochrome c family protein